MADNAAKPEKSAEQTLIDAALASIEQMKQPGKQGAGRKGFIDNNPVPKENNAPMMAPELNIHFKRSFTQLEKAVKDVKADVDKLRGTGKPEPKHVTELHRSLNVVTANLDAILKDNRTTNQGKESGADLQERFTKMRESLNTSPALAAPAIKQEPENKKKLEKKAPGKKISFTDLDMSVLNPAGLALQSADVAAPGGAAVPNRSGKIQMS